MKSRTLKILYWIFTLLFVAGMLFSGISELFHIGSADTVMQQLGYPLYLNTILGVAKLLGVLALLQTMWKTLKEWAYAGFTIDFIGAGASIYFTGEGFLRVLSVVPFLVVLFVSYGLWKKVYA